MHIFAAENRNLSIRQSSSSGGIFTMLALNTLKNGGVVYGAAFNDIGFVSHIRVCDPEILGKLRGSKYVFSDYRESLKQARADIENSIPVLYSGTPCQIAAIRKIIGSNPLLLCVEVVCHGAPASNFWSAYLNELCRNLDRTQGDVRSINFRDKSTGWRTYSFKVTFKDGLEFKQSASTNPYMRAFLSNLTLRDACFRCPFKYPNSVADITLGDLWGIEDIAPDIDNNLGTTLVIARTKEGQYACNTSGIGSLIDLEFEEVVKYNPAISTHVDIPSQRECFIKDTTTATSIISVMSSYTKSSKLVRIKGLFKSIIKKMLSRL